MTDGGERWSYDACLRQLVIGLATAAISVGQLDAQSSLATPNSAPQLASAAAPLVFRGVTIVDVERGRRLANQVVVVVDRRIQEIGLASKARIPTGARVIDARGKYVIPGLWDMHVHPMGYPDIAYPLLIANGVTGIRDAGSDVSLATLRQWKQEILAGTRVGPRVLVSGPALDGPQATRSKEGMAHHIGVATPEDARYVVDSLKAAGADFIKTYALSRELHLAVAAEARRIGIPFGGHSWNVPGLEISDSGATLLDHQSWLEPDVCHQPENDSTTLDAKLAACAAAAQRLRYNNTWIAGGLAEENASSSELDAAWKAIGLARARRYVPATFPWPEYFGSRSPKANPGVSGLSLAPAIEIGERMRRTRPTRVALASRVGMPIVMGTDAAIAPAPLFYLMTPGFVVPTVLALMVQGGVPPLEALQSATINPALALCATDSLGTVAAGKVADFVLLDVDPLQTIWDATAIRGVVANGRYYDRIALDELLESAERAAWLATP